GSAAAPPPPKGRPGTRRGVVRSRPKTEWEVQEEEDDERDIDPDLVVSTWESPADAGASVTGGATPATAAPRGHGGLAAQGGPSLPAIPPGEPVTLVECHLNYGFVLTEIGLAVVTEREIFGEEVHATAPKRRKG